MELAHQPEMFGESEVATVSNASLHVLRRERDEVIYIILYIRPDA